MKLGATRNNPAAEQAYLARGCIDDALHVSPTSVDAYLSLEDALAHLLQALEHARRLAAAEKEGR